MNKKLFLILIFVLLVGCGKGNIETYDVGIVTDSKEVSDSPKLKQITNGIDRLGERFTYSVSNQSNQNGYISAMERYIRDEKELILATNFVENQAIETIASQSQDTKFAVLNSVIDPQYENVYSFDIKTNESAFLVGYLAGLRTQSNRVGYIGFEPSILSDYYEYGFKAGLTYAAKELNKEIGLKVEYVDTFSDQNKGKELADSIYENGIDIIYQTVGNTGIGVIESAIEFNRMVIGNELDQSNKSKSNVLTSSIIKYDDISEYIVNGINANSIGAGKNKLGIKEDAVGIPAFDEEGILSIDLYNKAILVEEKIKKEEIIVPFDLESFELFVENSNVKNDTDSSENLENKSNQETNDETYSIEKPNE